jgi:hypothetical protein
MSDLNFSLASGVKPMIREAASMHNDGGGGNLGYMSQGKKKGKDKRRQAFEESIFGHKKESPPPEKDIELVVEEGFVSNFLVGIAEKLLKILG